MNKLSNRRKRTIFATVTLVICIVTGILLGGRFSKASLMKEYPTENERIAMINIADLIANEGVFSDISAKEMFDTHKYQIAHIDYEENAIEVEKFNSRFWNQSYRVKVWFNLDGTFKMSEILTVDVAKKNFKIFCASCFGAVCGLIVWNSIMILMIRKKKRQ